MSAEHLRIEAIPAFEDNYIWLITAGGKTCAVVDPGDEDPVLDTLSARGLDLRHILLTHHHFDHTGGVTALLDKFPAARVYGPDDARIPGNPRRCGDGDRVRLSSLDVEFQVISVPAHTRSHIAYYSRPVLFPGDTLFSIGCGRLFEGSPADMQNSLDKLATLPPETRIYCAHEYTASNCAFALQVEPENAALKARAEQVRRLRGTGEITLPALLADELAANPFLRTRESQVVEAARKRQPDAAPGSPVMAVIRGWKDRF